MKHKHFFKALVYLNEIETTKMMSFQTKSSQNEVLLEFEQPTLCSLRFFGNQARHFSFDVFGGTIFIILLCRLE